MVTMLVDNRSILHSSCLLDVGGSSILAVGCVKNKKQTAFGFWQEEMGLLLFVTPQERKETKVTEIRY